MKTIWIPKLASFIKAALSTHCLSLTFLTIYTAVNVLLFARSARIEWNINQGYARYIIPIARGCGQLVNLNLALLLSFASRSLPLFLRETAASIILPLDNLLPKYHSYTGIAVFIAGAIHGIAQCVVYILRDEWSAGLYGKTSVFITGFLLTIALAIVGVLAHPAVRRKCHEMFYIVHLGGGAISIICLILHGMNRGTLTSWKWIVGPISLYVLERIVLTLRARKSFLLLSKHNVGFHGTNYVRIQLPRLFHFEAGQYAEIRIPEISRWQWHPFTIASAPYEQEMVFYIKIAGDWTRKLSSILHSRRRSQTLGDIEVHVRGPFGVPTQHVGEYDHVILIGAGLGATPFCSVTKQAKYILDNWRPAVPEPVAKIRCHRAKKSNKSRCSGLKGSVLVETETTTVKQSISVQTNLEAFPSTSSLSYKRQSDGSLYTHCDASELHFSQVGDNRFGTSKGNALKPSMLFSHPVSRTVALNIVTIWALLGRLFNLGVAGVREHVSIIDPGLDLYKSRVLIAIDLSLSLILSILVIYPLIIEIITNKILHMNVMEGSILTAIFVQGATCDILALCNIGRKVPVLQPVQVFALWPLASAILLLRLIRAMRARISEKGGSCRSKDIFTTKSLQFHWTSRTALDDAWLLHELHDCADSSAVRLHRYLTRETESEMLRDDMNGNSYVREITGFGRPEWAAVFREAACNAKNGTVIGVFFCGPAEMGQEVQKAARQETHNSILRGLQTGVGTRAMKDWEKETGNTETKIMLGKDIPPSVMGGNIRFVFRKEKN